MKKWKLVTTLTLAIGGIFLVTAQTPSQLSEKQSQTKDFTLAVNYQSGQESVSIADAKMDYYKTLEEMEAASDVVVRGTKLTGKERIETSAIGTLLASFTDSSFKVSRVIKGNEKKDSTITVAEPVASFKGVIASVEGYKIMKEGHEYILFLKKVPNMEHFYGVSGVYQGKLSVDQSVEFYGDSDDDSYKHLEKLTKESKDKFAK